MAGGNHGPTLTHDEIAKAGRAKSSQILRSRTAGRANNGHEHGADCLAETIEVEIIPRLMLAHRTDPDRNGGQSTGAEGRQLDNGVVDELTRRVLLSSESARQFVSNLVAHNVKLETIFLDLLAPCARRLGDLWKEDVCDFCQVTLGLGQLQAMLREYGSPCVGHAAPPEDGRRALLTAAPGEQHTFGISMVSEFLTRAGWDVSGSPALAEEDLLRLVRQESFALVGLSLSAERNLEHLHGCIDAIRKHSRDSATTVMVGGPFFVDHPELAEQVGADSTACDAEDATLQAEDLRRSRKSK